MGDAGDDSAADRPFGRFVIARRASLRMTSVEISRKKSHAPRCRLKHDRRNNEQIDGTDSFHERSDEKRAEDATKLAAHADEREEAFALVGTEYIRHERPEDGKDEKVESAADPNEESCPNPKLCSVAQVVHREIKDGEIQNEKTVNNRDELASRHTRDDGREGSVGDKRNEQCASEHPPEILNAVVRADVIAHWFDDVVTAQDHEIKNEPEPECANLVRLYINDLGENFFHAVAAALRAACARRTATRIQFLLPRGKHFRLALGRKTG